MPVTTRYTSAEVRTLIEGLVRAMTGHGSFGAELVRGVKLRMGLVLLAAVQESFIEKARGGTGEDGIKWKPLSPRTIAARRLGPGDPPPYRPSKRYGSRPYLTNDQDKRWRLLFATRKTWFRVKFGLSEEDAGARAAQHAWATLKAEGAKTKLEVLGSRDAEIGRDTGRMFQSLSPGLDDPDHFALNAEPPAVEERILLTDAGSLVIGTNVEYAGKFHSVRPLWPEELPGAWGERIAEAAADGIAEALRMVLAA